MTVQPAGDDARPESTATTHGLPRQATVRMLLRSFALQGS
jgi:hypothetical protein